MIFADHPSHACAMRAAESENGNVTAMFESACAMRAAESENGNVTAMFESACAMRPAESLRNVAKGSPLARVRDASS